MLKLPEEFSITAVQNAEETWLLAEMLIGLSGLQKGSKRKLSRKIY